MNKKEIIELINGMINLWEEDTMFLSSIDIYHPAFTLTKKLYEKDKIVVISTILKRMEKELTWFFAILYDIVPEKEQPDFSEEDRGKIEEQTEMWLDWGREKGYIK